MKNGQQQPSSGYPCTFSGQAYGHQQPPPTYPCTFNGQLNGQQPVRAVNVPLPQQQPPPQQQHPAPQQHTGSPPPAPNEPSREDL
ncbi:unnamed protein product [Didymodactylos carnosus]|uniref:Uncharacterized protein n=1 Tax=Didymodactylos carnosus TaxID=1234261 RepID=A0A8S2DY03_9BILA|nr:unnamed protein product [Didymodactylos carnosus]CAF3805661.1 unnamed protein product [Didymodactylos carnosus]